MSFLFSWLYLYRVATVWRMALMTFSHDEWLGLSVFATLSVRKYLCVTH
jgi:hypothetical protein